MRARFLIAVIAVLSGLCPVMSAADGQATAVPTPIDKASSDGGVLAANRASYSVNASADCCADRVGDVNGDANSEPTVGDISLMIDAKFISMSCDDVTCISEADINQSGGANPTCEDISLGDIAMLIDYLFITGPSLGLSECLWGTVTDIDGNVYQTVTIGSQVWMAENLKVTHYRNGDSIPNVTSVSAWANLKTGAYCEYNDDVSNIATYGRLYNWHAAVDSRNIAPAGWHVPTDAEWQTLVDYLGDSTVAGGKMKEVGATHWLSPNTGATNESGFTALPGGCRHFLGTYYSMRGYAIFWSSTEINSLGAWYRSLISSDSVIHRNCDYTRTGYSVRCVKD
jgi:uncharacterized protein (TIGR02145 family)